MAFKDEWVDKIDGVDINSAEDINQVAHAIIDLEDGDVATLKQQVGDLMYKAIDITSFNNTVKTAEIGSVVDDVVLNWSTNKTPTELALDGSMLPVDMVEYSISAAGIKSYKKWVLTATDERGAIDIAETSISFLRGVYYGVCTQSDDLNNDLILSLARKLQSSKAITFTVNPTDGQYIVYAIPESYGTPTFNVGGFDGGFHLEKTFEFTNSSGRKESYGVWLSDNAGLGNTTVKVN